MKIKILGLWSKKESDEEWIPHVKIIKREWRRVNTWSHKESEEEWISQVIIPKIKTGWGNSWRIVNFSGHDPKLKLSEFVFLQREERRVNSTESEEEWISHDGLPWSLGAEDGMAGGPPGRRCARGARRPCLHRRRDSSSPAPSRCGPHNTAGLNKRRFLDAKHRYKSRSPSLPH